jgi:hypothetical protein
VAQVVGPKFKPQYHTHKKISVMRDKERLRLVQVKQLRRDTQLHQTSSWTDLESGQNPAIFAINDTTRTMGIAQWTSIACLIPWV